MINFNTENTDLNTVIDGIQEYLESAFIDDWMASNIITELDGIYIVSSDNVESVCYMDGDDDIDNISEFIMWEGEVIETVYYGTMLRNTNTYRDNLSKIMSMIRDGDTELLETVLDMIKQDSIRKYHEILGWH